MQPDIGQAITFEIKQEIANRYFGFRKLIEEDKLALEEKTRQYSFVLEKKISFDLIRIYILLHDEVLIEKFLSLIGLDKKMFYDPYLAESETIRQRVFEGVKFRGLTRKGRYKNTLFDCYERLIVHVEKYREMFAELITDHDVINEEIEIFYKKNDLSSILGFMRTLDDTSPSGTMQGGIEPNIASSMEKNLQLTKPKPIHNSLPIMPPLSPLDLIRKELKKISYTAFALHGEDLRSFLSQN
jgi:hypothetical protein